MLSKEEIKEYKELINSKEYEANIIEKDLIKYIEQLETNNKNLIEKLEEILKEYEHVLASEESAINLYSKIKDIVKGEKE